MQLWGLLFLIQIDALLFEFSVNTIINSIWLSVLGLIIWSIAHKTRFLIPCMLFDLILILIVELIQCLVAIRDFLDSYENSWLIDDIYAG